MKFGGEKLISFQRLRTSYKITTQTRNPLAGRQKQNQYLKRSKDYVSEFAGQNTREVQEKRLAPSRMHDTFSFYHRAYGDVYRVYYYPFG